MTHVFRYALERNGGEFTSQRFRDFRAGDELARRMLWVPAQEQIRQVRSEGVSKADAKAALRCRIGNAYYSLLRELMVVVAFREGGIDLRLHPLADALFRADAWLDSTVVVIYIKNSTYGDGASGRKPIAQDILGPTFNCVSVGIEKRHVFGRPWMPTDDDLSAATRLLRESIRA